MDHEGADDRGEQHGPKRAAIEVPNDLLQDKRDGSQRRIERRGESRRRAGGAGGAAILFRNAEHTGKIRRQIAADLHGGPLASQALAAADADDSCEEFDPRDTAWGRTEFFPIGEFCLRDAATCRFRTKGI